MHGMVRGRPPVLDLEREGALQALLLDAIRGGLVDSAHDCSDGGLAVALADKLLERHPESTRVLRVKREALARYGLSVEEAQMHIMNAVGGDPVIEGGKFGAFTYVFKSPQRSSTAVKKLYSFLRGKKLTKVALLTGSGAFAVSKCSKLTEVRPIYTITIGNQMDLTLGDYLAYLKDDAEIEVFAIYVEGFAPLDGLALLEAAREILAGKYAAGSTVKVGATAPQSAAAIHTDFEKGFIRAEVIAFGQRYGAPDLPTDDQIADLYETAVDRLAAAGRTGALPAGRTACASGLASRYLSRSDARSLAMIGTGALAPELIPVSVARYIANHQLYAPGAPR